MEHSNMHHRHGNHAQEPKMKEHANHTSHSGHNAPMSEAGHDHHAMMIQDFRKRFYVVLILTIPIMLLSPMIQHWLNVHWQFSGSQYLLAGLSSAVFFYGGWPFLKGWVDEMKFWKPGMMTLIGFAISAAYIYSMATV